MKPLAKGIYWHKYSIRAVVAIAAGRLEKRFDHETPLVEIKQWRAQARVWLETKYPQRKAGMHGHKTFNAAIKQYLSTLAIASWKSRRSELRAWAEHWGGKKRRQIKQDDAKAVIKAWFDLGVPPKTILNRCRALTAMYHTLDGETAWTPVDELTLPKPPKRRPAYVSVEVIQAVEERLRLGGDLKTHARYLVLTATGMRPAHLKRTQPADLDFITNTWNIPATKGGEPIPLPLNRDMCMAFECFVAADAWGEFDPTDYAKQLRAAGWPADVRPYAAKHALGIDLGMRGIDLETIRDWYGHTDTKTTRMYTGTLSQKLRAASEALDGRLGWKGPDDTSPPVPPTDWKKRH